MMNEEIISLIEKYGQSINIEHNNEQIKSKAFIQPVRYKNKQFLDYMYGVGGLNEQSNYLYLGKPENAIGQKDFVIINACDKRFCVVSSDMVFFKDTPLYEWAVLRVYHGEK